MRGPDSDTPDGAPNSGDHVSFQRLVLDLSAELIDCDASEVDEHILRVLASIGEFVGADRSYVFLMRDDGQLADNTHEWCSVHASPQAHRLQALDIDTQLPWFAARMRRFEVFHVPRVAKLPPEAGSERAEFAAESIKSLVVVPMVRKTILCGFLGFDAVKAERDWSSEAVAVLRLVGQMLINVVERKRAEQERRTLDARMREAQRLESLGLLAGGIAHDFNNLLTAVLGQASLARLLLPADHEVQRSLRLVSEAAQHAAELTRQLLAYSGRATFVRAIVDLSGVAREMGPLLEASTSTKGLLTWELLDVTMPGLNGAQVAERLRAIRPDVQILVASGFPAAEIAERMADNPPAGYLEKPFTAEDLLEALAGPMGDRG